ncbi:methyltransferase [Agromyces aurantiacus]|uniref:Methyltransferase n=1 Tax=Agromyces aurantiacus TaxID=165814 RepID=A0ABV9RAA3_9MICO|nr:methyltransferase [Agromyces aurantiacus]MBM7505461.1 methylase of polypeptide subunit release factors [Agromyces aurantiacus]
MSEHPDDADRELVEALAADLASARFTVAAIEELWERDDASHDAHPGAALRRGHRVPALRALARVDATDRPLATLVRCFVLGAPVPSDDLANALPTLGVAGAVELGLVAREGGQVRPIADLRPYAFADAAGTGEWWIASDLGELATGGALPRDHVLGVGGASTTLSGLLLQQPAATTLDLGTGCGIQAMHASRFSDRVIATDISERALRYARLNARLNALDGIEFRLGSLYEPLAGERVDRVVSNPPFVITPRRQGVPEYEYRDGGMVGDGVVEAVVRGAAAHLAPGGLAQLLGNWEYRRTPAGDGAEAAEDALEDGLERVAGWAAASGLEYWIVERERQDPSEYAETWIRDGGTRPGTPEFEALHDAWLDDFAARGVESVGFGYLLLRRPADGAAPRLARAERLHGPLGDAPGGLGGHLAECLAADDRIAALDDDGLRRVRVAVADDVTEERHHWPGAEQPTVILLRQGGGFGRVVDAGTGLTALVGAADGELPLGVLSDAIAQLLEADPAELWDELAAAVRELVAGGMLRPLD